MSSKELSRSEVVVDPPKPWLIYATVLTQEQIQSLVNGGAVELNLYVNHDTHIRVTVMGDHDKDIEGEQVIKTDRNFPMKGSWFDK